MGLNFSASHWKAVVFGIKTTLKWKGVEETGSVASQPPAPGATEEDSVLLFPTRGKSPSENLICALQVFLFMLSGLNSLLQIIEEKDFKQWLRYPAYISSAINLPQTLRNYNFVWSFK